MKKDEEPIEGVEFVKKADKIADALYTHENVVVGGTDFMWASGDLANSLDYLVVDEAGQFSLVGILSIAHATKNIILLGDGAQLKQPIQGSHPDGCETSALDHIVEIIRHYQKKKEFSYLLPTDFIQRSVSSVAKCFMKIDFTLLRKTSFKMFQEKQSLQAKT